MAKKKSEPLSSIESIKHNDKRANIPTEELRGFVDEQEKNPKKILYPRDPSLDPQLVWKGKDEQDSKDLEVPAVPIYIQEKIQPQAIIEEVRAEAMKGALMQATLFSDFNGIKFEELVDFYRHEQNWSNRMILGDSLLVMTSLAEKEGLKGKVQMIYIDPPYGIKFGSNWQISTRKPDVRDGRVEEITRQPEQIKAFRDTWELGIHSYLAYLRDRLILSRELLTESGSIFIQIGDENMHLVRCLLDEVFGSENFAALITFRKTAAVGNPDVLGGVCDYLIWYANDINKIKYRQLYYEKTIETDSAGVYHWIEENDGQRRRLSAGEKSNIDSCLSTNNRIFRIDNVTSAGWSERLSQPFILDGKAYVVGDNRHWTTHPEGMERLAFSKRLIPAGKSLGYIRYINDFAVYPIVNNWIDTGTGSFTEEKLYVVQTGTKAIARCMLMSTDPGDLVLDPTCGSGTTSYIAEHWGRRWITIDTSRVALALARTRLMTARYPYYFLADSPAGIKKIAEISGRDQPITETTRDIKKGFVYKRVPHITLKSIANNPEIDEIHERWQKRLEFILQDLESLVNQSWDEWQVPKEPEIGWPDKAKTLLKEWGQLRHERQREIDEAIARNADSELLCDQPYEDSKRIRVTGPFTVESLSPHRVLSTDEALPASEAEGQREVAGHFETMILENLKKAGIQNTKKGERLVFDVLEPYAGAWIQAAGEYTASDGQVKRVAVSIGPEHGTVGPDQVKEAAKEAVQGMGFDLLLICGFAFDPHVSEEAKHYGKLDVLVTRMNPDLAMGEELLKKTGAGNLFMVFGEPDITIHRIKPESTKIKQPQWQPNEAKEPGEQIAVEINGLDIYDPTTGEIRSSSTDDLACWFIDTNYNEESFFVRQAYFTGADEPYEKLKRALRAEIDEEAWAALYSTKSMPFDVPVTGKIAVKVINHYGDEVLKVFEIGKS